MQEFSYTYNAQTRNLVSRSDVLMGGCEQFQYDGSNRLVSAVQSLIPSEAGTGIPLGFEYGSAYTAYDGRGNVVRRSHDGVFDWYGEYSDASDPYRNTGTDWMQSSGDTSVNYGAVSMTSFDRPASVGSMYDGSGGIVFTYGADGERVKMELDAPELGYHVRRWYLGGVYEKDEFPAGSGEPEVQRLWLGGTAYNAPMAYIRRGSGEGWRLYNIGRDVQGSITEVMDYDGGVLEQYRYDPWGVQMCADTLSVPVAVDSLGLGDWAGDVVDTLVATPLLSRAGRSKYIGSRGWCGHEHLYGYGLINMNARLYDPMTGRFLSPDPLVQDPASTANFNRYAYCLNNPLKYTDESGEFVFSIFLGPVGAVLDAACWGALIGGASYTAGVALSDGGFNHWNSGQFWTAVGWGALSGAMTFGIGEAFASAGNFAGNVGTELVRGALHGYVQGMINAIQGGNFVTGFASGALGSIAGSAYSALGLDVELGNAGMLAFGALSGGVGSVATGGDFWKGAAIGLMTTGLNHIEHRVNDYSFFKRLERHYRKDGGEDVLLSKEEFAYLVSHGKIDQAKAVLTDDGYYTATISFYDSYRDTKYSFGKATIKYRPNDKGGLSYGGFHDEFNFDPKPFGKRSLSAEIMTRTYGTFVNGTPFHIYYNKQLFL